MNTIKYISTATCKVKGMKIDKERERERENWKEMEIKFYHPENQKGKRGINQRIEARVSLLDHGFQSVDFRKFLTAREREQSYFVL